MDPGLSKKAGGSFFFFFFVRGRPFDSEGGLALFGNKYPDLKNAGNK